MPHKYEYQPENAKSYKMLGIVNTSYEMGFTEAQRLLGDIHGKTFLDFGSGTGRSARFLKNLGAKTVIGVDHNPAMIDQAVATPESAISYVLINETIPVADYFFDGVFSSSTFVETKTLAEMKKSFLEIARVLKPDGIFILATANPASFGHEFRNYNRKGVPIHVHSGDVTQCFMKGLQPFVIEDIYWTEEDYRQTLESAGFEILEVSYPKATSAGDWMDETKVAPEMLFKVRKKLTVTL